MQALTKEQILEAKLDGFMLSNNKETFACRIVTGNGVLDAEQLEEASRLARQYGDGRCTFTVRMSVELPGIRYEDIPAVKAALQAHGMLTGGTGAKVRPVSVCKGSYCTFGFYDTHALAQRVHERFYVGMGDVRLPHKFKIAVGGCPNNCIKPDLNDVGLMGQRPPQFDPEKCRGCKVCKIEQVCRMRCCTLRDGKMARDTSVCNNCGYCVEKCPFGAVTGDQVRYRVYIGGRWGRITRHGTMLPGLYTAEEALDKIEEAMLLFRDWGRKGERFAAMIDRIGEDKVVKELTEGGVLTRREEILKAELS